MLELEVEGLNERAACLALIQELSEAVHDLCQPLTTLQCRLEIAGLTGSAEAYRESVELGLLECARTVEAVELMRGILRAAERSARRGESVGESDGH